METDVSAFLLRIWFMYIQAQNWEAKRKKKRLTRIKSVDLWVKYAIIETLVTMTLHGFSRTLKMYPAIILTFYISKMDFTYYT